MRKAKSWFAIVRGLGGLLLCWLLAVVSAQQPTKVTDVAVRVISTSVLTSYVWRASVTANRQLARIPVGSNKGFATVNYQVEYTRSPSPTSTYELSGEILMRDLSSTGRTQIIDQPTVSVMSAALTQQVPATDITCPGLVVLPRSTLTCTFVFRFVAGATPQPGSIQAHVNIPGTILPVILKSPMVSFSFAQAQWLSSGATAKVASYFEQGDGLLQPYAVRGEQPPSGLTLAGNRVFTFTALFGEIGVNNCDRNDWKAVNTAEIEPSTSSSSSAPQQVQASAMLLIELVGCLLALQQPQAPATPQAAPGRPLQDNTAGGPTDLVFTDASRIPCGSGICPAGQRCFDGLNCCPINTAVCGGICCSGNRVCLQNECVAQGSAVCGLDVCAPGEQCISGVCCPASRQVCGSVCCAQGQSCVLGKCVAAGSAPCGSRICAPGQQCLSGSVCCAAGQTNCGGRCCMTGYTCLQNRYCVPSGSTLCGSVVCAPQKVCLAGFLCCNPGATMCNNQCCAPGSSCQMNRCLLPGYTACGANTCRPGLTCLRNGGKQVCCKPGETFCNTGCCAQGRSCINNQCVPSGYAACGPTVVCNSGQFCGNTFTGLCCQRNQIACGTNCCQPGQLCNSMTLQCQSPGTCPAGQSWCASASACCPVGWICGLGACIPRRTSG